MLFVSSFEFEFKPAPSSNTLRNGCNSVVTNIYFKNLKFFKSIFFKEMFLETSDRCQPYIPYHNSAIHSISNVHHFYYVHVIINVIILAIILIYFL